MNWISYAERTPEPEPNRQILAQWDDGDYVVVLSDRIHPGLTHWSEITPPKPPAKKKRRKTIIYGPPPEHLGRRK